MRRRLMLIYLSVTGSLMLALAVPLGLSFAMDEYHHLAITRLNDTVRFADQATPVLLGQADGRGLREALRDYQMRNDVSVIIVDTYGSVLESMPAHVATSDSRWRAELPQALARVRSEVSGYPYNIRAAPLYLAEPVEWGTTMLGAVVTISPTTQLRAQVGKQLVILLAAALLALLAAGLLGIPTVRWISRPVRTLDAAATAIAAGRFDVRAPIDAGPPEIRRLARAVNAMADRMLTLLRAQRSFVADASHQMRNPLTALQLRVENLEPFVAAEGRTELEKAITEAQRFAGVVNSLLTLARTEAREVPAVRMDARAVARERVDTWRPAAQQLDVRLTMEGPAAPVSCAPDILDQVLDVLLDNAVHIAPAGSTVRVRTVVDASSVAVHVSDQGPGMTAQDKTHACDRFWRGREQDGRSGSGLGLAIAKTLLGVVGGALTFDDVVPRGLEVIVGLQPWPDAGDEVLGESRPRS